MSDILTMAVLHCTRHQPVVVIKLGKRLINYLFAKILIFATPIVTQVAFEAQLKKASDAQDAMDDPKTADVIVRDEEVKKLFFLINKLLFYVNSLYLDDAVNLSASGFDLNKTPTAHGSPMTQIISDVVEGDEPFTAHIILEKVVGETALDKVAQSYLLQMAIGSDEEEKFITILATNDSQKLIAKNIKGGVEVFFRVAATNAAGLGNWSNIVSFIHQK